MSLGIGEWIRVGLGVGMGGFRDRGWRRVGLGVYLRREELDVYPWILCSAVRTIYNKPQ